MNRAQWALLDHLPNGCLVVDGCDGDDRTEGLYRETVHPVCHAREHGRLEKQRA